MQTNAPGTASETRASGTWIAPLFSTLLTLPVGFFAFVFAIFSPMSCDSCGKAEADRFDAAFDVAFPVFLVGLLVPLALLIAAWSLPRRTRYTSRRALFAVTAPLAVVADLILFVGLLGAS
ncbi:hypothetical protein [Streptomyces sp. NPDC127114]|uniref:hypothetical protein n=1 Tax=Streptomyces sp. NPDC127114 TaxID=3345366 RepID=UPI00363BF5B6